MIQNVKNGSAPREFSSIPRELSADLGIAQDGNTGWYKVTVNDSLQRGRQSGVVLQVRDYSAQPNAVQAEKIQAICAVDDPNVKRFVDGAASAASRKGIAFRGGCVVRVNGASFLSELSPGDVAKEIFRAVAALKSQAPVNVATHYCIPPRRLAPKVAPVEQHARLTLN